MCAVLAKLLGWLQLLQWLKDTVELAQQQSSADGVMALPQQSQQAVYCDVTNSDERLKHYREQICVCLFGRDKEIKMVNGSSKWRHCQTLIF